MPDILLQYHTLLSLRQPKKYTIEIYNKCLTGREIICIFMVWEISRFFYSLSSEIFICDPIADYRNNNNSKFPPGKFEKKEVRDEE
jgi:hypothetical protein